MAGPRLRAFRSRAVFRALLALTALGRALPLRVGQRLGRALGTLAWYVAPAERRKALANIAIAFPEWTSAQQSATIRETFRHLGSNLFEVAHLWRGDPEFHVRHVVYEGIERLEALVANGRSAVIFTSHCGNWEWLGAAVASRGIPLAVVARERDDAEMNRYTIELHARGGVKTIERGSSAATRELIAALRNPGLLGFLIDQAIRAESVKVPFFGRDALTVIGPARLAIRTEAFAAGAFIERLPDGRQFVRILEPIECHRGDDPVALTARMTLEIEKQIKRAPAQWVWMHNRWRYRAKWDVDAEG